MYQTYLWMFFVYFLEPCTVINSDSSLIVDIEESRGNQVTQDIIPTELEISGTYIHINYDFTSNSKKKIFWFNLIGTTNDIELILVYTNETQEKYFDLEGKKLRLIQALDRDLDDISSLQLSVRGHP